MNFLKTKKRLGQFETLEAKKLFAADLAGPADVVMLDPGDCSSALTVGPVSQLGGQEGEPISPGDCTSALTVGPVSQLGGQEGEPVMPMYADIVLANLGGQEGEDITGMPPHGHGDARSLNARPWNF